MIDEFLNKIITYDYNRKSFLLNFWTQIICNKFEFKDCDNTLFSFSNNDFVVAVFDKRNTIYLSIPYYKLEGVDRYKTKYFKSLDELLKYCNVTEEMLERFIFNVI